MIEIPILFFISLCVPDFSEDDGYDCEWQIVIAKYQENIDFLWYAVKGQGSDHPISGMILYHSKVVVILEEKMTAWNPLGCTILWHEILHAWGYSEETIPKCTWQPKSTKTTWQVIIPS